jgi:hypothetical protein
MTDQQTAELQLSTVSTPSRSTSQAENISADIRDNVAISAEAQKAYYSSQAAVISGLSVIKSGEGDSAQLRLIGTAEAQTMNSSGASSSQISATDTSSGGALPSGWGVEFSSTSFHYEAEQMRVSASGSVTTQDGRDIKFSIDLGMSREYTSIEHETITARAVTTDPLVINFSGGLPGLSDTKFVFDLNNDGENELVYATASGSGFLALDGNGDGKINNGSELFGPTTGSGFSELSSYDGDRNGWIDENDGIFAKLSIWTKDAAGNDKLLTLKEAGIGALSVSNVASGFSLTDGANQLKGQVQSSGIYLTEQGGVGAMQQIDLAAETQTGNQPDEEKTGTGQQTSDSSIREVMADISRLVATASWLAEKSREIGRSLREERANELKGHGGNKDSGYEKLGAIGKIIKFLNESAKANSEYVKEHKQPQ